MTLLTTFPPATLQLSAVAQASTLRIVDCLLEGTFIAIFAGVILRAARLRDSRARFAVWFFALISIAALPLLAGISLPAAPWTRVAEVSGQASSRSPITLPISLALYVFAAWAAIAGWFLLGVGRSLWHLYVLRRSCIPVDTAALDVRLQETLEHAQSPRPVALCTSDRVHVPTALGLAQPVVVIPAWALQELSTDELNQILLHELAHLRRWDDWTNLAQKLVKALFFFHPAVWWIEKQVSLEREMACDDAVLAETSSPRAYAECLAHLAERTLIQRDLAQRNFVQRSAALAQAALGRIRQTSLRVAQILDVNRESPTGRGWKPAVALLAVFAVTCVLGVARAPRLIAFHDIAPAAPASVIASLSPSLSGATSGDAFLARPLPAKWGLTKVKATTLATHRKSAGPKIAAATRSSIPVTQVSNIAVTQSSKEDQLNEDHRAAELFHLTSTSAAPVAFTETLFVVVEGQTSGPSDSPVVQIRWWRVVVLHPVADPDSNRIPPKQT
jgi:beta-lactamase regulating signal transducer with metallopeptidase domain